ncbi:POTRA domain-containing protein, partial [Klebsiella pneumoniae]|uniref:POTRA domain-containing protein n=1 Tax=Klebsiella pneumoniae TaxID=573 RepID=UPI00272F5C5B
IVLVLFFLLVSLVAFSEDRIVELDVRGNEKTKDFVVAQLIGYREGMVLDIEQLYIGKRALENSGLFRDVYISVVPVGRD